MTADAPVQPKRPLTLRDVSEAAGVSEMTVSRVLRNRGDVSETTRNRVLEAAKVLGYVPNKIAGALASQRVNLVGVIIPSLDNMVFPEVMSKISEVLDQTHLQPVVGVTNYLLEREEKVLYEMLSWRPSGFIIAGLEHSDSSKKMLRNAGIPVVEILDTDGTPIDSVVGISHRRAGRVMAEAVIKAGYRRIGFLGARLALDHRARKRFEGFSEALAKAGLEVVDEEFCDGASSPQRGREMTEAILARTPDLDFLACSNDMIGAGGLLYCKDNGLDVPHKIGLSGFNDISLIHGLSLRLATINSGRSEIGRKAAEIIAARAAMGDQGMTEGAGVRVELTPSVNPGDTLRKHPTETGNPE